MPGFITTERLNQHDRPIIEVEISPGSSVWYGPAPAPTVVVKALVDTGATHSVLSPALVKKLALNVIGQTGNETTGGIIRTCNQYALDVIYIGKQYTSHLQHKFTVTDCRVLEDVLSPSFDLILGWDSLFPIDLKFNRDRTVLIHLPG